MLLTFCVVLAVVVVVVGRGLVCKVIVVEIVLGVD